MHVSKNNNPSIHQKVNWGDGQEFSVGRAHFRERNHPRLARQPAKPTKLSLKARPQQLQEQEQGSHYLVPTGDVFLPRACADTAPPWCLSVVFLDSDAKNWTAIYLGQQAHYPLYRRRPTRYAGPIPAMALVLVESC